MSQDSILFVPSDKKDSEVMVTLSNGKLIWNPKVEEFLSKLDNFNINTHLLRKAYCYDILITTAN